MSKDAASSLHGILAEYETPSALVQACKKVRDAGYKKWDTFTPFPIHGIDKAMGIRMTGLPWIVLVAALTGLATAIAMQWWMNAVDYKFISSGKPMWSIPANVPVYFELTVLFSAFAALGGMLALNNLPQPYHPLDLRREFAKATDDRFFLYIEREDEKFDEQETRNLLDGTHPESLAYIDDDDTSSPLLPKKLVLAGAVVTVIALIPFAVFAKMRNTRSAEPKLHAMGDMDWQVKFQAQQPNPLFQDNMAMRAPEPGTVAVDEHVDDDHLTAGKVGDAWARVFPTSFELNDANMARGKQRYEIFCGPCHGVSGNGDGMVSQRAGELAEGTWVPPSNLHQGYLKDMAVGQIYDVIANGVRNMPPYGPQMSVEDRWAVVLYLRALQKSKGAPAGELTDAERAVLK
jgi:mono/diheme cytochrome c family protein